MALSSNKLEQELLKLLDEDDPNFVGFPATVSQAAQNWGDAYHAYAQDAVDVSSDALVSSNLAGYVSAWSSGMTGSTTTTQAANAYESAFVAYWSGAVFSTLNLPPSGIGGTGIFSSEITSIVTAITPNVLYGLLEPEFQISSNDPSVKAAALATAIHTATTTAVLVLISGLDTTSPPSGPLPITNTDTIH